MLSVTLLTLPALIWGNPDTQIPSQHLSKAEQPYNVDSAPPPPPPSAHAPQKQQRLIIPLLAATRA